MQTKFFTAESIESFAVFHTDGDTGEVLTVRGEPEILEVLNERVAVLIEENQRLSAALEFYSLPESIWVKSAALAVDKGFTARKALGKE